jgi:hypothetical protein
LTRPRVLATQTRGYTPGSWFKKDGQEEIANEFDGAERPKIKPEDMEKFAQSELMQSLMKHPECMDALAKTQQMMIDKGYVVQGEAPSIMTQARMLADSELRQQLIASMCFCGPTIAVTITNASEGDLGQG